MKTILISILLIAYCAGAVMGQTAAKATLPNDKSKMQIFSNWIGKWSGEGSMQQGPGAPKKSNVEETIEWKLDGMIVAVEGIGRTADDKIVHHAFGVLSYDQLTQTYKFKTYLKDGKTADAWFEPKGNDMFQWGFDVPSGKIRYTITIDPEAKKWAEVGEFTQDGNVWQKFFEMNLLKQN
jgi:hypothetical protein